MNNVYPDPWTFSNMDAQLQLPNGAWKVEYGDLGEVAMGGPAIGNCYLLHNNRKIQLPGLFGAPVIWNDTGDKVALPRWTNNRNQQNSGG